MHLHIYPIILRGVWQWALDLAVPLCTHTEHICILNCAVCCMRFTEWDLLLDDSTSICRLHLSLNALLWLSASHSGRPLWFRFGIFLFCVYILFVASKHSQTDIHKLISSLYCTSGGTLRSSSQYLLCKRSVKYFWPSTISSYIITACCSDFIRPMLSTCFLCTHILCRKHTCHLTN